MPSAVVVAGTVQLVIHHLCDHSDPNLMTLADFTAFVDRSAAR